MALLFRWHWIEHFWRALQPSKSREIDSDRNTEPFGQIWATKIRNSPSRYTCLWYLVTRYRSCYCCFQIETQSHPRSVQIFPRSNVLVTIWPPNYFTNPNYLIPTKHLIPAHPILPSTSNNYCMFLTYDMMFKAVRSIFLTWEIVVNSKIS